MNSLPPTGTKYSADKSLLYFFIKLIMAVGLIVFIIIKIDVTKIIAAFEQADLLWIAAAYFLSFVNVYLQYTKWKLAGTIILIEGSRKEILLSLLYGISAGIFTPMRIGEFFGRALVFKNKTLLQITTATLIDKLSTLAVVIFAGGIAVILYLQIFQHTAFITNAVFLLIWLILFTLLIFFISNPHVVVQKIIKLLQGFPFLSKIIEQLKSLKEVDRKIFIKLLAISFIFYLCFITQYAFLAEAFSKNNNLISFVWAGALVMFTKTIVPPITIGELGIREGASVFFIMQMGESGAAGFNASIFLFIMNILLPSVAGVLLFLKTKHA